MQELRRHVALFRASGKWTVAYMERAGEKEYFLASGGFCWGYRRRRLGELRCAVCWRRSTGSCRSLSFGLGRVDSRAPALPSCSL